LPIAPEFAEFLLETPWDQRTGYVFQPPAGQAGQIGTAWRATGGRIVSAAGDAAKVKVDTKTKTRPDPKTGKPVTREVVKFASAHDLRRSFGEPVVKPSSCPGANGTDSAMRASTHTSGTYVGHNAQATAGDSMGGPPPKPPRYHFRTQWPKCPKKRRKPRGANSL